MNQFKNIYSLTISLLDAVQAQDVEKIYFLSNERDMLFSQAMAMRREEGDLEGKEYFDQILNENNKVINELIKIKSTYIGPLA